MMSAATHRLGLSEREYAKRSGVSRVCIQKARASGRLVVHPDGSIDADASDVRRAQATDPAMQRGRRTMTARPVPGEPVYAAPRDLGLPTPGTGATTYLQARTAHEVLKVQERRMRLQRQRGEFVDRARAVALVFRLARKERDAWIGWPARIAAQMAADLGVNPHATQTVLEAHVRQHLEELADIQADFR